MLIVNSRIEIGSKFKFDFVAETEVVSTWKQFTDTATIRFPRRLREGKLDELVKRGDVVVIYHGYGDELKQVFNGYLAYAKPTVPVELQCEDEMFILKQRSVTPKSWENASLNDILNHIGINYFSLLGDISILGSFDLGPEIKNAAQALEKLKTTLSMPSFFRDGVLVIGKPYDPATARTVQFQFGWNIISHSLEYRRKEEIRLRVKAISNLSDGSKIEETVGDTDGEERTLNYFNLTADQLKAAATNELSRLKYDGYRGKIIAFGEPFVRHGDIVDLSDPDENEKDGKYFVDKVVRKGGRGGYRQEIELGPKAA